MLFKQSSILVYQVRTLYFVIVKISEIFNQYIQPPKSLRNQQKFPEQHLQPSYVTIKIPRINPTLTKITIRQNNSHTLMIAILVLGIFNLFGILYSVTILLLGLLLPFYCHRINIYVSKYYVEVLVGLLWLRLWNSTFSSLDGIFVVALWHPNLRLAEKFVGWLKKTVLKDQDVVDKISHKINRVSENIDKVF